MQGFMIMLIICSLTMSALALLYMAVTPYLAKRYSVTGCYYSWLVIVVGLIIPFRPQFGKALVRVELPDSAAEMAAPVLHIGNKAAVIAPAPTVNALPSAMPSVSWWQIAAAVWLAGMVLFLACHVRRHCRFLKLAARWSADIKDEQTLALLHNLKAQLGISQTVGLQCCDSIGSPMLTGFVRPRILLPAADFTEEELRFILKHELIHCKRKDLWYKCLVLLATAVHWFNPIVYLMTKAIDTQCELSCDAEVVRSTDADTRLYYSETIIGVIRYRSKLKTSLSTNFYGGKKGMKERISSIMDMNRKKAGAAVLGGVLILTLGTGSAFAAKADTQAPPKIIQENISEDIKEGVTVSPDFSFGYGFLPDPEVYSQYSSYGITVSDDGKMLYNGRRVRLFVDEHSDAPAFFLDEAGALDLTAARNAAGKITGIEQLSKEKAQEYRFDFFADDIQASTNKYDTTAARETATTQETVTTKDNVGKNKYEQYASYGVSLSSNGEVLQYNGQRVKLFVDKLSDGSFETFWVDKAGTVNLSVARNSSGAITAIESLSEAEAQKYNSSTDE